MEELFRNVLESSLYGSVVILTVLALRLVLNRAPRRMICLLWLLAGLRLVMPFSLESSFSLQPRLDLPAAVTAPVENVPLQTEAIPSAEHKPNQEQSAIPQTEAPAISGENTESIHIWQEKKATLTWKQAAAYVWALGILVMGTGSILSYLRLKKQVREACLTSDGFWECTGLDTAFVLGFFPPKIYLPMDLPGETRGYILAHEKAHIARGDHWVKLLGYLVLMIHWFNPLVWVGYHLLCRDMEGACDEQVIRYMDLTQRKAYSGALLSCAGKHRTVSACPVAFGETSVKQRILSVLRYQKPGFWLSLLGIGAVIFVAVCLLTSPGSESILSRYAIPEGKIGDASLFAEQAFTGLSSEKERKELVRLLRGAAVHEENEPEPVKENSAYMLVLQVGNEEQMLHFSPDCHYVWLEGKPACRIKEPEELTAWFTAVTEGVRGRETSGEPFASVTEPEAWLRGISPDAVSSAYIHAQGESIREGNTTTTSASFGYFAARRFDELIEILNDLPDRAVMEKTTHKRICYGELQNTLGVKGGVYISLTDPVNGLVGVVLLDSRDTIKLLLTDELDKVERNVEYLDNLHCWIIEDETLAAFLRELWVDPPVITYLLTQEEVDKQGEALALSRLKSALASYQSRGSWHLLARYTYENRPAVSNGDIEYWEQDGRWLRIQQLQKTNGKKTTSGILSIDDVQYRFDMSGIYLPEARSWSASSQEERWYPYWLPRCDLEADKMLSVTETHTPDGWVITTVYDPSYAGEQYEQLEITWHLDHLGELKHVQRYEKFRTEEDGQSFVMGMGIDIELLPTGEEIISETIESAYNEISQEQREKALAAMYTAQCKTALEAVQTMDHYHISVSYEFYRGTYKEKQHTADYWFDGENLLRTAEVNGMTHMMLLHNSNIYQSRTVEQSRWEPLKEGSGELKDAASWVMYYVWNDGVIQFVDAVESDDGMTVFLQVDQSADIEGIHADSYELLFTFDTDGNLKSVGLGTQSANGTTMVQHIEWIASDYEEIQQVIQDQIYSIQLAG